MRTKRFHHTVDDYLLNGCMRCALGATPDCKVLRWTEELTTFRAMALQAGLEEDIKWGMPCYSVDGGNVLIVAAFKDYCAVTFFKGVLLKDPAEILELAGPNSHASRVVRCTNMDQVRAKAEALQALMVQAVEVQRSGATVDDVPRAVTEMPEELERRLDTDPELAAAFFAMTPGRQRSHMLFIGDAKQTQTRETRVDKSVPMILAGRGIHDR